MDVVAIMEALAEQGVTMLFKADAELVVVTERLRDDGGRDLEGLAPGR
ncbi:hypothetical protein ABZ714_21415 [Streptomyces sp. NPDC006798]